MLLSSTRRFLIGGIGGLAPVFALLIAVDLEKNLTGTTTLQVVGYLLRVLALFAIGGFIAWLHETEDKPFKLFEIGLGAPALLAGLITTNSIIPAQQSMHNEVPTKAAVLLLVPVSAVYAQQQSSRLKSSTEVKTFSIPRAEGVNAFWQGLLGTAPKNIYYVIVGSHLKYEDAKKQADQINSKFSQYSAEVYAPYGGNPNYGVVIGANLPKSEAATLRSAAIQSGLPKDTYLWTFPSLR